MRIARDHENTSSLERQRGGSRSDPEGSEKTDHPEEYLFKGSPR